MGVSSARLDAQLAAKHAVNRLMKRILRPLMTIGLGLVLALLSAAISYPAQPPTQANLAAAAFFLQPTKTPPAQNVSQIGSTDAIVVMGFVIALIIIVPIVLQRKSWMEPR